MDREELVHLRSRDVQPIEVELTLRGDAAHGRVDSLGLAFDTAHDPLEDARVVPEAGPDVVAVLVLAEPVDLVDLRQFLRRGELTDLEPVRPVVRHVVTAERQHGEGVAAQGADTSLGGSGLLRGHRRAHEDAVLPIEGLRDERHVGGAATAEEDRIDRHALRVLPVGGDGGALPRRGGEARVGVRGGATGRRGPVLALPVDEMRGRLVGQALPPHIAVIGERDVGEDAVGVEGLHGVGIGVHAGAGGDAEETRFGVDGVEASVLAEAHPRDVVTDCLDGPAGHRRLQHGEVGLAACRGEGSGDVADVARGSGELEHQHVLGHPTLIARHGRGDAQGEALLAQQGVAAVARAEGPDLTSLGEVGDVLRLIARPGHIRACIALGVDQRIAHRMHSGDEVTALADLLEGCGTHAGHDLHVDDDVRRVGELDTELRDVRTERTHREGHDIHRAAAHRTGEETAEDALHLDRVHPVVGGTGISLVVRADVGAALDARDIAGVGARKEGVGTQLGVEADEGAAVDHLRGEALPLSVGAIAPDDLVGLRELRDLFDPLEQLLVAGGRILQATDRHGSPFGRTPLSEGRRSGMPPSCRSCKAPKTVKTLTRSAL